MKKKSRRQFVLEGISSIGGWYVASELVSKLSDLKDQDVRKFIPKVRNPDEILYVWDGGNYGLQLGLCEPGENYTDIKLTWRDWFDREGIDPENKNELLQWAIDNGEAYPEDKEYECPELDEQVHDGILELYKEWDWEINHCPEARAFHFLSNIELAPEKAEDDPLGNISFLQGEHPGSNMTAAFADSKMTIYGLHNRLLEMGHDIEIKFGEYW